MKQKLLIDGYNVVYADDAMRRVACRDLERARGLLISALEEYLAGRRVEATVVFDGRGRFTDAEVVVPGALQAVFSPAGQSADELILKTLREAANPRAYIVVTSDMKDIGGTARSMGCEVIGSRRFLERIGVDRDGAVGPEPPDRPDNGRVEDVDFWLRKFEESGEDGDP